MFGQEAELYDRLRPGYPSSVLDAILDTLPPNPRALDAGAGTGRASVLLAQRGVLGLAVEPDPAMAAVAERNLRPFPRWRVRVGAFESFREPIATQFDLVLSAQAWHWMDVDAAARAAAALLRPRGLLAVLWNRPSLVDSPVHRAVIEAWAAVEPDRPYWGMASHVDESRPLIPDGTGFEALDVRDFEWKCSYSAEGWSQLLKTTSEVRRMTEARRLDLVARVRAAINEHGGDYPHPYVCRLITARRS